MALAKHAEEINEKRIENMDRVNSKTREQEIRLYASIPLKTIPVDFSVHIQAPNKEAPHKKSCVGRNLRCCDCGKDFVFTVGEQMFFNSHGYHPPKRCRACRERKRKMEERRFWNGLVRSN